MLRRGSVFCFLGVFHGILDLRVFGAHARTSCCFAVGSSRSTTASTIAALGDRRADVGAGRTSAGVAQRKPCAPQAFANPTKSIGPRSHPQGGLPNSCCSKRTSDRLLFFRTTI